MIHRVQFNNNICLLEPKKKRKKDIFEKFLVCTESFVCERYILWWNLICATILLV